MTNQTRVTDPLVQLETGRGLGDKLGDIINAADYGALSTNTASANSTAINAAIVAANGTAGCVTVNSDIAFDESLLSMLDGVILIVLSANGTATFLNKDHGNTLPITKGGLVVKSRGNTGVLLRNTDYGVTAEPFVQFLDATTGDLASVELKLTQFEEITDPTAPTANKAKLYVRDNGAGKTQLVVRFPTGAVQQVAIEP